MEVDFKDNILKDLKKGPMMAKTLADKFGVEKVKVVAILNDLRKQDKVVCDGKGRTATWSSK